MGTDIAKRDIPTPTPRHDRSLSPQELADHRQKIASEVKIILSAYFQPHETQEIQSAQLAWWCDELQEWTREQVVYALRQWNRDEPRRRPTPGDITQLLKQLRGRKEAERMAREPMPEPPKERISKERAQEILAEAGFAPKRMETDT